MQKSHLTVVLASKLKVYFLRENKVYFLRDAPSFFSKADNMERPKELAD